jgi:hypothetical protein
MGRSVNLWKAEESDAKVAYWYGSEKNRAGRLVIDKLHGTVSGEPVPGMSSEESWFLYGWLANARAEQMIGDCSFPDEAHMAV